MQLRLDLQWFAGEKTEKATPKKRQKAREEGQVAKSSEIPGAFIMLFFFLTLWMFGSYFGDKFYGIFTLAYSDLMQTELTVQSVFPMFGLVLEHMVWIMLPFMLIAFVIAFIGNYVQIGFLMTSKPLLPKLSKMNPISGAKRIFGLRALVEFAKSLLKLIVIAIIVYVTLWADKEKLLLLSSMPIESSFVFTSQTVVMLGIKISVALVIFSILDYIYQKYEHEKSLKMSKQDVKDEHKNVEGDPKVKGRIRETQRRMALQRMMQEVPKADVVITNPTHFAVALKYDGESMDAPRVIAKGQDYLALKIKEIAKEHDVPLMENKPLARALYAQVEVGGSIPADLFQAVAEVLAYVYKIRGKVV